MIELESFENLATIAPSDRVLLLPHCLRPIGTCPGTYSRQGLICPEDCSVSCVIRILHTKAKELGYKGVCVAPGGSMVLRFVRQTDPKGIVAVACEKELELGVRGVEELVASGEFQMPVIAVVHLSADGCVDTEVDVEKAVEIMESTTENRGA